MTKDRQEGKEMDEQEGPYGLSLGTYVDDLVRVPDQFQAKPALSFDAFGRMGPHVLAYLAARFGGSKHDIVQLANKLPMKAFARLSVDEMCKVWYSAAYAMGQEVSDLFENDPRYEIVQKIVSSMWGWGWTSREIWNEVVDAYDAIRRFTLDLPDFDVLFDHTTWRHEQGWSKYSETYLDGVFGYLVRYRGEHVMTVGFSIAPGRRLLVQQIQTRNPRGNRWLFRFPRNRVEFLLDRLTAAFPAHSVHLVDGESVARKNIEKYRTASRKAQFRIDECRERLGRRFRREGYDPGSDERAVAKHLLEQESLAAKISHLEADLPRLSSFYSDVGRYRLGETVEMRELVHYAIAA
jgi:hypothetical protein